MRILIIRPHVIWGASDPLSTEMLLSWPPALPLVLIGDLSSEVIAVRVDSVAQYILTADAALFSNASLCGLVFNVGDERVRLGDLHARIVMLGRRMPHMHRTLQRWNPAQTLHVESRERAIAFSFGCLRRVDCTVTESSSHLPPHRSVESFWVVVLPQVLLFFMLLATEISDICFGISRFESSVLSCGFTRAFDEAPHPVAAVGYLAPTITCQCIAAAFWSRQLFACIFILSAFDCLPLPRLRILFVFFFLLFVCSRPVH